jgi:hypothetical protein
MCVGVPASPLEWAAWRYAADGVEADLGAEIRDLTNKQTVLTDAELQDAGLAGAAR